MTDNSELDRVLELSDDELLLDLGSFLVGGASPSTRGEQDDMRGRARNWLERSRDDLRTLIFGSELVARAKGDPALEIAAVADLISSLLNGPAAFTVAAIMVKHGLDRLCI